MPYPFTAEDKTANLAAINQAVERYRVIYNASFWPLTWIRISPEAMQTVLIERYIKMGYLDPEKSVDAMIEDTPMSWGFKATIIATSITTAVLFATWAWRRTFK